MNTQDLINVEKSDLDKFFIHHLNKVYAAKTLLISELPQIMDQAHFSDLRQAMLDTVEGVKNQIERMDEIYEILPAEFLESDSSGLKGLVEDSFKDINHYGGNPELRDMSILFYLHNIESIEMASFQILEMASVKLKNDRIKQLIKENYEEAKADRTLLLLISAKYISTV
ncbi:DUF892 family protein [Dyadobacter psychrotolerans]|uniref:DUF892 family protein n=1 Tax=Dyadobacter psychrotolerans TaxID=2541721 RepID=A0A4R5DS77_9BACT|nr:DUF892 family protein [Dyadobacter psychrotolerans]TDE17282.1 DUF892 family protein [Dyadobacter psychrotolerans]